MADAATIRTLPQKARFSLRVAAADTTAAAAALGVPLGSSIGEIAHDGERHSLRLGPDEWTLSAPLPDASSIAEAWAASGIVGSLVETSHRDVAFAISGPAAEDVLSHGCPRDLSRMAPGRGARTVFDGVGIFLWRFEDRFEVDVWNSYAPFLETLLATAARELTLAP